MAGNRPSQSNIEAITVPITASRSSTDRAPGRTWTGSRSSESSHNRGPLWWLEFSDDSISRFTELDRKLEVVMSQLHVCMNGIEMLKMQHRQQDGISRSRSPGRDRLTLRQSAGITSRQVSEDTTCTTTQDVDDVAAPPSRMGRCSSPPDLPDLPELPDRADTDKTDRAETTEPLDIVEVVDISGGPTASHRTEPITRSTESGGRPSVNSSEISVNVSHGLQMLKRAKSHVGDAAWRLLEDSEGQHGYWWGLVWTIYVMLSVPFSLMMTQDPPLLSAKAHAVVETAIEGTFALELIMRCLASPEMKGFIRNPFNIIDAISVSPILLRAAVGFVLLETLDAGNAPQVTLVCAVPVLRLAKVLRRNGVQAKLFERVLASTKETLQFLALVGGLIVLHFSFWIYLVEPRDTVDTYWRACWLTIVTMTTVGYGDVTPVTTEGNIVISILIVCSVLFMAIPIGVLGNAFAFVWSERDLIMMIDQTKRRLAQWGYAPVDFPKFFLRFDEDGDGELNLEEFTHMMNVLQVNLQGDRMIELFQVFDRDHGGSIDEKEFLRAVYPQTYHEILHREKEEKEKKQKEQEAKREKLREERQRFVAGRGRSASQVEADGKSGLPSSSSPLSLTRFLGGSKGRVGSKGRGGSKGREPKDSRPVQSPASSFVDEPAEENTKRTLIGNFTSPRGP